MKITLSVIWLLCYEICSFIEIPLQYVEEDAIGQHTIALGRRLEERRANLVKKTRMYTVSVLLGSPPQSFRLKLSSLFQGIGIVSSKSSEFGYHQDLSSSYKMIESHSNNLGEGTIVSDTLTIPDLGTMEDFTFFLSYSPKFNYNERYSGLLGLAYYLEEKYDDSAKCMFDFFNFYKNNEGTRRGLMGLKSDNTESGFMYVGDFPFEVKSNKKKYRTCKVSTPDRHHSWRCNITSVYFEDNDMIPVNRQVDIILGGNIIGVNKEIYWAIKDKYFAKAIDDNKCFVEHEDDGYIQLVCSRAFDRSALGTISLVIGKWTLKLKMANLFYESQGMFYFIILTEDQLDYWYISPSVLLGTYVFLDKDNKEIGFFESDQIPQP